MQDFLTCPTCGGKRGNCDCEKVVETKIVKCASCGKDLDKQHDDEDPDVYVFFGYSLTRVFINVFGEIVADDESFIICKDCKGKIGVINR